MSLLFYLLLLFNQLPFNSVVIIEGHTKLGLPSTGTGIVLSSTKVLTNAHVVGPSSTLIVTNFYGTSYVVRKAYVCPDLDVALLITDHMTGVLPANISNESPHIGQEVYALGHPFALSYTLTRGIISSTKRIINKLPLIQLDAAVNRGNSGGPLFNTNFEVLGINTVIASRNIIPSAVGFQGLAFAIPIKFALKVANLLEKYKGVLKLGFWGVDVQHVNGKVIVLNVATKSPLYNYLKPWDIIKRINGTPINDVYDFYVNTLTLLINQKISVVLQRGGREQKLEFNLKGYSKEVGRLETFSMPSVNLNLNPIPPSYRILWGLPYGVVADDSYRVWGINKGDAILELNGNPINNQYDLIRLTSGLRYAIFRIFSPKTKKYMFVRVFFSP